jgi:tryptophan-rich sensory protein
MKSLRIYGMLAVFILICLAVGGSGAAFPPGEWYRQLAKPPLNPPAWVFGPVWTLLYILMGVSAWLVWLRPGLPAARIPLLLFAAQMALNGAWSWIFFGFHQVGLALIDIVLLWAAIAATLISFWRIMRPAAVLLFPYLLWVSFATYLNAALWRLNP